MSKRKLAVAAGALILIGGAAAIAAVGHREGRMAHSDRMYGMDMAQLPGEPGPGAGHGMREGERRFRRGGADQDHERDMRRGWLSRALTAEEFEARTRERFARLDKNSDGVVDATEVEAEITARRDGRGPIGDGMRQRIERRNDASRDGKVTRQEMLDRVKRDFARADLDGDGRITDMDLPPVMRGRDVLKGEAGPGPMGRRGPVMRGPTGGPMGGIDLGRWIAADANKDGIITLEEVLAAAGRRFDLADSNKDGVLDSADRDALRKEMTDYGVRRFLHAHGASKDGRLTRDQFFTTAKERFAERDINNDGRLDRQDFDGFGPGRGRGMEPGRGPGMPGSDGPGQGPGSSSGPSGGPGMRDRGPPPR